MLENLTKKQKIIFILIIIFMVCVIVYYIYSTLNTYESNYTSIDNDNILIDSIDNENDINILINENINKTSEIIVHVSGCVKQEKIVSLPEGSRINDAIEAVGGLTKEADLTNINLAYILEDGEKIYIPKKGDESINQTNSSISENTSSNQNLSSTTKNNNSKININKATKIELETIPGIGPSTASKIINYRNENGKFKTIEDIKNVSGIGDSKYQKIKDYIIVK